MSNSLSIFSGLSRVFSKIKSKNEIEVVVLFTSDIHGAVAPYDYILDKPVNWGLAQVATRVNYYRKKYPNTLLVDNGDFLQGSPLNYYYNFIEPREEYPLCKVMNKMDYTAASVGNHDIEQGPEVYNRIKKELQFPWLSANAITKKGRSHFQPFTIREIEGIKVALLGLTTPAIPMWLNRSSYPGIRWQDMREAAQGWVKYLKKTKKVDLLIGLFHAGIHSSSGDPDWPSDIPEENPCEIIARENPEYDLIISGHEHLIYNSAKEKNGKGEAEESLVMLAGSHGQHLGVVRFVFRSEGSEWVLKQKEAKIESLQDAKPDRTIMEIYQPFHQKVMNYINSPVGETHVELSSKMARIIDNGYVNLIHGAQFANTTAQISLATVYNTEYVVKRGLVRIKDVYGMYPYENHLYVVLMTGKQLKDHLERSAGYFNKINPGKLTPDTELVNPDFKGFNYDMAQGVRYEIDITKPVGKRIVNLIDSLTGKPLNLRKKYKVAINSYRAVQLHKTIKCPILWRSNKELRDLLVEYIRKVEKIDSQPVKNWKLVPENTVNALLKKRYPGEKINR